VAATIAFLAAFFVCNPHSPAVAETQDAIQDSGRIVVVPIQLEKDLPGLVMIDTVGQTLWIYEINTLASTHNKLRLLAARSWQYDRLLQRYNTADPAPEQVRELLEKLNSPAQSRKEEVAVDANELSAVFTQGPNSPEKK
jgi:hypothetical protein